MSFYNQERRDPEENEIIPSPGMKAYAEHLVDRFHNNTPDVYALGLFCKPPKKKEAPEEGLIIGDEGILKGSAHGGGKAGWQWLNLTKFIKNDLSL